MTEQEAAKRIVAAFSEDMGNAVPGCDWKPILEAHIRAGFTLALPRSAATSHDPQSPYGCPPENVLIPEGWESLGVRLVREGYHYIPAPCDRCGDAIQEAGPVTATNRIWRIIVCRKQLRPGISSQSPPRRWVVEEIYDSFDTASMLDSRITLAAEPNVKRVRVLSELPRIDDALLDRMVGAWEDYFGDSRDSMRAVLQELGLK